MTQNSVKKSGELKSQASRKSIGNNSVTSNRVQDNSGIGAYNNTTIMETHESAHMETEQELENMKRRLSQLEQKPTP